MSINIDNYWWLYYYIVGNSGKKSGSIMADQGKFQAENKKERDI